MSGRPWRLRKDGSPFWASVVLDPIFDESGKHVGFAKITRDITERKKAQEQLEEAQASLVQSQKLQALGELTGGIAHDFNNLMTVIAGSADFLLRKPDLPGEKRRQYLEAIGETADRATTLTNHLLAFGRRQPIKPEVLDLNVRLDAVADMLSRTLGSVIRIELDLQCVACRVEVDVAQLETAILNAAVNARDAMPEGGTLTLSTRALRENGADFIALAIRDTGTGMPKEVINRAFEPFFTTKEVGKGTGLGLSQIHGFAAQAGGRAEISSEEGCGTTIALVLPRTEKDIASAVPSGSMSGLAGGPLRPPGRGQSASARICRRTACRPRLRGRLGGMRRRSPETARGQGHRPRPFGRRHARHERGRARPPGARNVSGRASAVGDRVQRRDRQARF